MIAYHLQIKAEHRGPVCVLAVSGDLDVGSADQFTEFIQGTVPMMRPRPRRVVIDLSGLRFIDCRGARALAAAARSAPGRCPVVVRSVRHPVRRVLDLLGVDLDLLGPNLDLIGLDVERVRGSAAAVAQSPTGRLVRQSRLARSWSAEIMEDSRRAVRVIAATEDKMAVTLGLLADQRPTAADRLTALSEEARTQAWRLRDQARRSLAL